MQSIIIIANLAMIFNWKIEIEFLLENFEFSWKSPPSRIISIFFKQANLGNLNIIKHGWYVVLDVHLQLEICVL